MLEVSSPETQEILMKTALCFIIGFVVTFALCCGLRSIPNVREGCQHQGSVYQRLDRIESHLEWINSGGRP